MFGLKLFELTGHCWLKRSFVRIMLLDSNHFFGSDPNLASYIPVIIVLNFILFIFPSYRYR